MICLPDLHLGCVERKDPSRQLHKSEKKNYILFLLHREHLKLLKIAWPFQNSRMLVTRSFLTKMFFVLRSRWAMAGLPCVPTMGMCKWFRPVAIDKAMLNSWQRKKSFTISQRFLKKLCLKLLGEERKMHVQSVD